MSRFLVVGGGIFGQTIAWRLALRGVSVTIVEAVAAAHVGSQSGDRSRIVRALYGEKKFALAGQRSLELWDAWGQELGEALVDRRGVLYLERDSATESDQAFARFVEHGIQHVRAMGADVLELDAAEVERRYPAIATRGLRRAVFEPGAGLGHAARATRAIARAALATGKVHAVTGRVERLVARSGRVAGVELEGSSSVLEADVVVLAAGWTGARLTESLLGIELGVRPIPHFATYWDVPMPEAALLHHGRLVVWAELGAGLYGFPDDGEAGFKVAWHEPLRSGDDRAEPTDQEVESLRLAASARFPALARAKLRGTFRCTYDATADESFRIGWAPGVEGLYVVTGLSGHGFKHAPVLGASVAAVLAGRSREALVDLSEHALPAS
jgi:glycine/D-amino acid oxidase-like deaminating enzyme